MNHHSPEARRGYLCIDGCVQIWPDADFASIPALGVTAYLLTAFDPYVSFRAALKEMSYWHGVVERYPGSLRVALVSGDILAAHDSGRSALILGCQGLNFVSDDLWALDVMHRLGLRVAQLTYNDRNMVADGCLEPGGAGLSGFGRRVVAELSRLGIVLDLSHVGERSSLEAMDATPGPAVISHANPRAVVDSPRNISDAQIRACAAGGGVIGLSPWGPLAWRRPELGRPALEDYIACLEYVIEMVGIDHVGVGTDLSIGTYSATLHAELVQRYPSVFDDYGREVEASAGSPLRYVAGFDDLTRFQAFGGVLASRGYSDDDVRKVLGGNFLRVFSQVWDCPREV
ncbi:MAG: membrane dipeptidase [Bacillota bacterium]|nr:membrane dipeptidase [Bacillota bacterium]